MGFCFASCSLNFLFCILLPFHSQQFACHRFIFDLVFMYIALDWKTKKKAWPLSDSDLVCYCLSCLLCGFAFLFVLMSKKFWLCIWFLFIPSILLHFSFPVTLDLFFLGFADVCCYFVLLYPSLELRFCSFFFRFVFGSFWPLCSFSCVKSFHLCIWFLCILLWTEKLKKGGTFVWFWFSLLLFILSPLWFCLSIRFDV